MSVSVMIVNRIRDIVSNLGWKGENNTYNFGENCLGTLERLEEEILNEDVTIRNVRLSLQICGTVQDDLLPILVSSKDPKVLAAATRLLVTLSLPVECLLPIEDTKSTKHQTVRNQLVLFSDAIKLAFLDFSSTLSVVTMLRETMIKSEKHSIPLVECDCNHLKNCLFLIRNILHVSEDSKMNKKTCSYTCQDWQSVQNKLIWNLFVQGLDGALVLMLNSKYRLHWTIPLALIIALLYRNQNIGKIHQALESISSASESSDEDDESDGSKSSDNSKNLEVLSDSGYLNTSDHSTCNHNNNFVGSSKPLNPIVSTSHLPPFSIIHKKFENFQINEDVEKYSQKKCHVKGDKSVCFSNNDEFDSENSSCDSPYHKKIKSNFSSDIKECNDSKHDSAVSMNSSSRDSTSKSSDDDGFQSKKTTKHLKIIQKLRCLQAHMATLESDSSNDDFKGKKIKQRNHPPTGRRGKSPRKNGCSPSICMDAAYAVSCLRGRIRYPLWEKRNSVSILVDMNSSTPTNDEIGHLLKEFTLSFIHGGFSYLVLDIMNLILEGQPFAIDKTVFFWLLSFFLHLATTLNVKLDHISGVISFDVINFLVYECVIACERVELQLQENEKLSKYITVQLNLILAALKEVTSAIDLYSKKCAGPKDKYAFNLLCGKIADLHDLRYLPFLLFQNCPKTNARQYLEDLIIFNHYTLSIIVKGADFCWQLKKMNIMLHLKAFSNAKIVHSYGKILENFKTNSSFLNECIFTMMHHLAGDINSADILFDPAILKTFSEILADDKDLDQYQEDLIMYIMNKFTFQVEKKALKMKVAEEKIGENTSLYDDSSSDGSVDSNISCEADNDDLFWWYLQFEQDPDPITQISEHVPILKEDILKKLQLKGFISQEMYKQLEEKISSHEHVQSNDEFSQISNFNSDITHLLRSLVQAGERQHVLWIQDVLLEICFIKLNSTTHVPESVPFHCLKLMQSVPLVPYTEDQKRVLKNGLFIQLLQKLGFQLGLGSYEMYPRIPFFWTVDVLFAIAARLGPIKKETLKFSYEDMLQVIPHYDITTMNNGTHSLLSSMSSCFTLSSWLSAVQEYKENKQYV